MSRLVYGLLASVLVLSCSASWAGEILILQPSTSVPENRNEREAQRLGDRARQNAGQAVPEAAYILGPAGMDSQPRTRDQAERLMDGAREYLDPAPQPSAGGGGQVILRAAPLSDAERARLKARGYVTEPTIKSGQRNCGAAVTNQVGTVGEGDRPLIRIVAD